ncbi:MAG: hypothetical protein OXB84_03445 [Halobacteriovoraceae bacterium]|nr:hypothetical protein [Halobacteriovoraceae bacterium]
MPSAVQVVLPPIPEISKKILDVKESVSLNPKKERRYNLAYIREIHSVVRHQKIDEEILSRWINVMDQGGSREGIYRALISDDVYASLEGKENTLDEKVTSFTIDYTSRFLSKGIKEDILQKTAFYILKRLIVERTLEIIDSFEHREHLERWYAVFSGEMAEKYPQAFGRGIRRITEKRVHLKWANFITRQHIKSEIIVKLHLIYNFLQSKGK